MAAPAPAAPRAVGREMLVAAALLGCLLGAFFSPDLRYHATFSSVGNVQRYFYPWVKSGTVQPSPRPIVPQIDQALYVYPKQVFLYKELRKGRGVPLWNPLSLAGTPFFAQTGSRLAYPPLLLLSSALSPASTHDAYLIVHLFVAGLAMFALMRRLRVSAGPALLSAIAWMFSSYAMAWIMLEMFAAVAALLPMAILFVRRWDDRRSTSDLLVAGLCLGLLSLGTSGDLALFSFIAVVGYAGVLALVRACRSEPSTPVLSRLGVLASPVLLAGAALAVGAATLLPYAQFSGRSLRTSVPIGQLPRVPFRYFLETFRPPPVAAQFAPGWLSLNAHQVFVGTLTALLAGLALFLRRTGAGLSRALVIGTLMLVTVPPAGRLVARVVPFVGQVANYGRALFLWDLGLAILGGIGLDASLRWLGSRARASRFPFRSSQPHYLAPALVVGLVCVCLVVTSVQLFGYGRRVNADFQPRRPGSLFPSTPAVEAVRHQIGEGAGRSRALGVVSLQVGEALVASSGMAVDLPLGNGYEPVVTTNVGSLWRVVAGEPLSTAQTPSPLTFLPRFNLDTMRADLLGRVGVAAVMAPAGVAAPAYQARGLRQVYSGQDGTVFAVDGASPRASVATDAVWVRSEGDALAAFTSPSFDDRRQVVLRGQPGPSTGPAPSGTKADVRWVKDAPDDLELSVTSPTPGWLVLRDSWDPDWRAAVNGRGTRVEQANFGFRAVRVPAGASRVTFSYHPTAVVAGVAVSAGSALAIVLVVAVGWVRTSRRRSGFMRRSDALS